MGVEQQHAAQQKSPIKMFFVGLAVVLAVAGAAAGAFAFRATRNLSANPAVVRFAEVLGLSVAKVNGIGVPYADYIEDVGILNKYYATEGGESLSENDISDQVLSRLVVAALINDYAKKYGVSVSPEDVQQSPFLAQVIAPFGTREGAEQEVMNRYGLTFDRYVEKVVYPVLVEQKLQEAFTSSTDDAGKSYEQEQVRASHILFGVADAKKDGEIKRKAQGVLARIKKGEDFAALAAEFGEDGTKSQGGDLGWFGRGRMVPEFEQAVFDRESGLVPELVKTQFGYHIVRVDEKRTGRDYTAFMGDQIRLAKVEILIPKVHNPFVAPESAMMDEAAPEQTATGTQE